MRSYPKQIDVDAIMGKILDDLEAEHEIRELFPRCAYCGGELGIHAERLEGRNRLAHRACIALREKRIAGGEG